MDAKLFACSCEPEEKLHIVLANAKLFGEKFDEVLCRFAFLRCCCDGDLELVAVGFEKLCFLGGGSSKDVENESVFILPPVPLVIFQVLCLPVF